MGEVIKFPIDRVRGHKPKRCADCDEWLEPQDKALRCEQCDATRITHLRKGLWSYIESRLLFSPGSGVRRAGISQSNPQSLPTA